MLRGREQDAFRIVKASNGSVAESPSVKIYEANVRFVWITVRARHLEDSGVRL